MNELTEFINSLTILDWVCIAAIVIGVWTLKTS